MEISENNKRTDLETSIDHYHKMVEEVEDYAIILLDNHGNIQNWNRGAEKIKGYSGDEIIGQSFRTFYFKEDVDNNLPDTLLALATENGKASHEGWRRRKDNTKFWGSIVITAIHDNNNNVVGFTKVTRDLTERKFSEDKIRQYNSELEFKNRELSQFVSIASHDLQEPLRKIGIFTGLLKDNLHDKELAEKYLDKISVSAVRMSNLINEILKYSLLSGEQVYTSIDLNQILEQIKEDFEILIQDKMAVINYKPLPLVKGIPVQLHQLFLNIIGNALKFSNGIPVIDITFKTVTAIQRQVLTELSPEREYIEFRIKDNGIGFSPEYSEKIFKMFQRLDVNQQGTGIGLALCKKIIENHHGCITAESAIDVGTTITFYLPV